MFISKQVPMNKRKASCFSFIISFSFILDLISTKKPLKRHISPFWSLKLICKIFLNYYWSSLLERVILRISKTISYLFSSLSRKMNKELKNFEYYCSQSISLNSGISQKSLNSLKNLLFTSLASIFFLKVLFWIISSNFFVF